MAFLRPEARLTLIRWRETAAAVALVAIGAWFVSLGGWVLVPVGVALAALGAGWTALAVSRVRFARQELAPGLVEIDEGQVGYLGPTFGGYVALGDLSEVRLLRVRGLPHWRLKQSDGQAILIPHGATGAEALFDAFATLPGADMTSFGAALAGTEEARVVWSRPARLAAGA